MLKDRLIFGVFHILHALKVSGGTNIKDPLILTIMYENYYFVNRCACNIHNRIAKTYLYNRCWAHSVWVL